MGSVVGALDRSLLAVLSVAGIGCQGPGLPAPVVLVKEPNILGEAVAFDDSYLYWTAVSRQAGPQLYRVMRQPRAGGAPEVVAEEPDLVDGALVVAPPLLFWGTQSAGPSGCGCLVVFDGSARRCLDVDLGCNPTPIAVFGDTLVARGALAPVGTRFATIDPATGAVLESLDTPGTVMLRAVAPASLVVMETTGPGSGTLARLDVGSFSVGPRRYTMDPILYAFGVAVIGEYVYWVDAGSNSPTDAPRVSRLRLDGSSPAELVATFHSNAELALTTSVAGEIWLLDEDFPAGDFSLVRLDPTRGTFDVYPVGYQPNEILSYGADLLARDPNDDQILDQPLR